MDTHCNIAYHNPCSNRFNNQEKTILGILERIQNTTVLTNSKKSECCGASFPFAFINNELSLKISENNSRNIINSGADIALTACPLCHIGLKQGFLENNSIHTNNAITAIAEAEILLRERCIIVQSKMSINTTGSAPPTGFLQKQAFKTPEKSEETKIIIPIMTEPYRSSIAEPKRRIKIRLQIRTYLSGLANT